MPKGNWVNFSNKDINKIIEKYRLGYSTQVLGKEFKCDPKRISRILKNNNIEIVKKPFKFSIDKALEISEKYKLGMTLDELAIKYDSDRSSITSAIKRCNVKIKDARYINGGRVYKVNDSYFENIDTEDKAYWLGFIVTDGCVSRDCKNRLKILTIHLKGADIKHLKKFNRCIDSTYPICINKSNNNSVMLRFSSEKLCSDLGKYGVIERKSGKSIVPKIPEHLYRHFWRGCIDGDGHIGPFSTVLYGNFDLVNGFKQYCDKLGLNGRMYQSPKESCSFPFFSYTLCGDSSKKLGLQLYNNCLSFLDRKYKVFYCIKKVNWS